MLFNSFAFLLLIPIVLVVYYLISESVKSKRTIVLNAFLLLLSYVLYVVYVPKYFYILLAITIIAYFAGRYLESHQKRYTVAIALVIILAPLLFFKYCDFVVYNVNDLLHTFGIDNNFRALKLIAPLGISFFTFQAYGYVYDVYKRKIAAERNMIDFMLFMAFFPQIASGPISKASELLPQIKNPRHFDEKFITSGFKLLLWGYFLKLVLADRLAIIVALVFENYTIYSGLTCFIASILYTIQIYGDFAGYSFMAVGVGRLLGYDLILNFVRPYFATSVSDFWHRWHISLSRWLRDYVYIPLGGSRCSKLRNYVNILITFFVSGLWHGANWTFIAWGGMHGAVQCIEKYFKITAFKPTKINKLAHILVTFIIVNFAWIFFRLPTLNDACQYIKRIACLSSGPSYHFNNTQILFIGTSLIILFLTEYVEERGYKFSLLNNSHRVVRWTSMLILVFLILLCGVLDSSQFIYVNF